MILLVPKIVNRTFFEASFAASELERLFAEKIGKSRTVGADGTRASRFGERLPSEIELIRHKVFGASYQFTKYKEKLISKGPGKIPRVISIPTVRDRLTLRALCNFLAKVFPESAIRKPHAYIKDIRKKLEAAPPDTVFLRIDIKDYYGSIDQKKLLSRIRRQLRVAESLALIQGAIRTGTGQKQEQERGIPQGLSISNILASVYLADCDAQMLKRWTYYRYVDDILIICDRSQVSEAFDELQKQLRRKRLKSHELNSSSRKSYVATITTGVEYLGFNITPGRISVRDSSYKRMFRVITAVITSHKYKQRLERVIWRLNLKITGCRYEGKNFGWMFFFLQTDDLNQLARLDSFVRAQLKRGALDAAVDRAKSFVKTYHEIRYNLSATKYVPDFDNYTVAQMRETISLIRGEIPGFETLSEAEIHKLFFSIVGGEVSALEKDLMESVS